MFGLHHVYQTILPMKNAFLPIYFAVLVSLNACYTTDVGPAGPQGPRGPQGPQGPQGEAGESGYVFEWSEIHFTSPDYAVLLPYPEDFEGLDSDVALVYLLWEVDNEGVEIWRQIPTNIFLENGRILQYNFDFTKYDVNLFLDGNFNLDELGGAYTDEWVARIVVVPGNFVNSGRVDFSDYKAVEEALGLPDFPATKAPEKRPD